MEQRQNQNSYNNVSKEQIEKNEPLVKARFASDALFETHHLQSQLGGESEKETSKVERNSDYT